MAGEAPSPLPSRDATNLARQGSASFLGASFSAAMGFVLTFVLSHGLGEAGTGVVLQATGIFAIVASIAKLGMDSAAVWLGPRHAYDAPGRIRSALTYMIAAGTITGVVAGAALTAAGFLMAGGDGDGAEVGRALLALSWALPVFIAMWIVLAATRGLGGVLPYVVVGNVLVAGARPLVVMVALAAGGGAVAVAGAWALPLPVALVLGIVVLRRQIVRHERPVGRGDRWPTAEERGVILRFGLPRTLSAGLEQGLLWLDVVIVGIISGSAQAGVYGGASRFIAAGLIVDTALRVVVSPRFSQLIHAGRLDELHALYGVASRWLVLFSTPIFVLLAGFAPAILGLLGPGFDRGATTLVVLSAGATLTLAAGNIHSVLLMSGHSGWAAFNKAVVLAVNIVGNLVLIPRLGINGAAIAWTVAMLLDAVLASVEVRTLVGIGIQPWAVGYGLLIPLVTVGVPTVLARALVGPTVPALLGAALVGGLALLLWCRRDRQRLGLDALQGMTRRGATAPGAG